MNARETYHQILTTLNYSDIVWTKYGSETKEELAARITRITFSGFEIPKDEEKPFVSLGNWVQEYSSGYNGFRCTKCATWIYCDEKFICDCDKI